MTTKEIESLIDRLRVAVAHMPLHQREREQGKLLIESLQALNELTESHSPCKFPLDSAPDCANLLPTVLSARLSRSEPDLAIATVCYC